MSDPAIRSVRCTSIRDVQSHATNVRVGSLCDGRLVACGV
jgi:hypothetical protein